MTTNAQDLSGRASQLSATLDRFETGDAREDSGDVPDVADVADDSTGVAGATGATTAEETSDGDVGEDGDDRAAETSHERE